MLEYYPGDTIGILSENPDKIVNEIINRNHDLHTKCNNGISLKLTDASASLKKAPKFPINLPVKITTLFKLLKESIDLNAIPKKALLVALIKQNCVTNPIEKRFLEILASREGSATYVTEILQNQKSFYGLFSELSSLQFSFETITILFEHLPRLMPRPYSISTSSLATKSHDEYEQNGTILKIIFSLNNPPGITTRMLEALIFKYLVENTLDMCSSGKIVNLYLRQSNRFRLTDDDLDSPLIMIAIGTGVAPFLGFLEHRREVKKKNSNYDQLGYSWLIFGCRQKHKQLCHDQLNAHLKDGTLSKLSESFSRDSNVNEHYVQDHIRAQADKFIKLSLQNDGKTTKIFICGNKKMAQDVRMTIEECLIKVNKCSAIDAKEVIDELIMNGRYIEDIWI